MTGPFYIGLNLEEKWLCFQSFHLAMLVIWGDCKYFCGRTLKIKCMMNLLFTWMFCSSLLLLSQAMHLHYAFVLDLPVSHLGNQTAYEVPPVWMLYIVFFPPNKTTIWYAGQCRFYVKSQPAPQCLIVVSSAFPAIFRNSLPVESLFDIDRMQDRETRQLRLW